MYTVQSASTRIEVKEQRSGFFKVLCNSTGGRALRMTVTGPAGFNSDLNNIQPVGDPQRIGDDELLLISYQEEDIYQCAPSNGVSSDLTDSVELRGTLCTCTLIIRESVDSLYVGMTLTCPYHYTNRNISCISIH